MEKKIDSVLQDRRECFLCKTRANLHEHHVMFGVANRSKAEKWKLKVFLCEYHHTGTEMGVHHNRKIDLMLKEYAQKKFEEMYDHETWMKEFGKNYL